MDSGSSWLWQNCSTHALKDLFLLVYVVDTVPLNALENAAGELVA